MPVGTREGACALHSDAVMPRKQRFKPSRKPKVDVAPQVDDRQEIHPDEVETGSKAPPHQQGVSSQDPVEERSR